VRPGKIYDLAESVRVVHSQIGERLAVEFHLPTLEAVNEFAIADIAHSAGGTDTDNPESPEHALAHPAVAESENTTPDERHQRLANEVMPALPEAFGQAA
jgi:hypothetical protein